MRGEAFSLHLLLLQDSNEFQRFFDLWLFTLHVDLGPTEAIFHQLVFTEERRKSEREEERGCGCRLGKNVRGDGAKRRGSMHNKVKRQASNKEENKRSEIEQNPRKTRIHTIQMFVTCPIQPLPSIRLSSHPSSVPSLTHRAR